MISHEHRRSLLWTSCCEHLAVLPWVRQLAEVALTAGMLKKHAETRARQAELVEQLAEIQARLVALDPVWCGEVYLADKCNRWTRGTQRHDGTGLADRF